MAIRLLGNTRILTFLLFRGKNLLGLYRSFNILPFLQNFLLLSDSNDIRPFSWSGLDLNMIYFICLRTEISYFYWKKARLYRLLSLGLWNLICEGYRTAEIDGSEKNRLSIFVLGQEVHLKILGPSIKYNICAKILNSYSIELE